jgi:hypothetical protein
MAAATAIALATGITAAGLSPTDDSKASKASTTTTGNAHVRWRYWFVWDKRCNPDLVNPYLCVLSPSGHEWEVTNGVLRGPKPIENDALHLTLFFGPWKTPELPKWVGVPPLMKRVFSSFKEGDDLSGDINISPKGDGFDVKAQRSLNYDVEMTEDSFASGLVALMRAMRRADLAELGRSCVAKAATVATAVPAGAGIDAKSTPPSSLDQKNEKAAWEKMGDAVLEQAEAFAVQKRAIWENKAALEKKKKAFDKDIRDWKEQQDMMSGVKTSVSFMVCVSGVLDFQLTLNPSVTVGQAIAVIEKRVRQEEGMADIFLSSITHKGQFLWHHDQLACVPGLHGSRLDARYDRPTIHRSFRF